MLLCELESIRSKDEGESETRDEAMANWLSVIRCCASEIESALAAILTLSESSGLAVTVKESILEATVLVVSDISARVSRLDEMTSISMDESAEDELEDEEDVDVERTSEGASKEKDLITGSWTVEFFVQFKIKFN